MTRPTSKDLLDLERKESSSYSLESALLVCQKDSAPQISKPHSEEKLVTTSVRTSQVLGKVKDFLGVMAEANERLQLDTVKKSREEYDIEVLTGDDAECIEMDLMLGVADLKTPEAVAAAESTMAGSQPVICLAASSSGSESESNNDSGSDDDDDDDDESKFGFGGDGTCRSDNFKKPALDGNDSPSNAQPKKRAKIVELI